jgi:hypothetical protein
MRQLQNASDVLDASNLPMKVKCVGFPHGQTVWNQRLSSRQNARFDR